MRVPCPTCDRLGKVPKALPPNTAMSYCGPNGERVPYEMCQTCNGQGWMEKRSDMEPGTFVAIIS
jgi:DnaJ-class molecular chaperone